MNAAKQQQSFLNYYRCYREECGHEWQDVYPAQPDDDCPVCGARHCSPFQSNEVPPADETMTDRHYLVIVEGDVEPCLDGSFGNGVEVTVAAATHRHSDRQPQGCKRKNVSLISGILGAILNLILSGHVSAKLPRGVSLSQDNDELTNQRQ